MFRTLSIVTAVLAITSIADRAHGANLVRISGAGVDAAGCGTPAAPCRTLQFAHDQVDAKGYVVAIDPADFGPVVVAKSITISNESAGAALINAPIAIDINAPGGVVGVRGMTLQGEATAIQVRRAAQLNVVDCVIQKSQYGVASYNGAGGYPEPRVFLSNTSFSGGTALWGPSRAMFVSGARLKGAIYAITTNTGTIVLEKSLVEGDPSWPTYVAAIRSMNMLSVLRNSVVRNAPIGLDANSALFLLSRSTISANALAFKKNDDRPWIQSFGDNVIRGNTDDALGLVTPAALH